jgi:hypothetical protein
LLLISSVFSITIAIARGSVTNTTMASITATGVTATSTSVSETKSEGISWLAHSLSWVLVLSTYHNDMAHVMTWHDLSL